jgi:arylsulfatase A-like enzyme
MIGRREFVAALGSAAVPGRAAARPPNLILVLADDLGAMEPGCYGSRFNRTPHLDRLAARGVRFTEAYAAAPVCSPTRAALMTGLHPARVGITDFLGARDEKFLDPAHGTLPKMLKPAGYASGLIGKWHLMGDYDKRRGDPKLHGFDEVICSETRYIGPGDYFHPYGFMPEVAARREGEYLTDRLNQEAVDFIERHRSRPFFLYLAHYAPHTRLAPKPDLAAKYESLPDAGTDRNNPALAAMLESIDQGVGMIAGALRRRGLAENTVVLFTSDNGGESRVTSNAPLRGGKSQLYEGGIRVPLIAAGPGIARGGASRAPVSSTDLYPTLLDLAGVRAGKKSDGESIAPLLRRPSAGKPRTLFWHYPLQKPHFLGGRSSGAVRAGDFKLIEFFDTGAVELYNVAEDPGETRDLAAQSPDEVARMKALLERLRADATR